MTRPHTHAQTFDRGVSIITQFYKGGPGYEVRSAKSQSNNSKLYPITKKGKLNEHFGAYQKQFAKAIFRYQLATIMNKKVAFTCLFLLLIFGVYLEECQAFAGVLTPPRRCRRSKHQKRKRTDRRRHKYCKSNRRGRDLTWSR